MKKLIFTFFFIFTTIIFSQSVVVNKYFNSGQANGVGDLVELLVVQNNLDMRGMLFKDFSSSMAGDGGGKFEFTTNSLWQSLKAGTLIILRNDSSAADINSNDFIVDVGLKNSTYFTPKGGTYDLATTEMVMVKVAGSDSSGVVGSIHVLAGGTAGTNFTAAPNPKLKATGTSPTNKHVFAKNSTSLIADYDGTDADTTSTTLVFGQGNNATNTAFINTLRGGISLNTTVQFALSSQSVNRNAGTVKVNVAISNPSSTNPTSVQAALTGGTGVNGVDIQNYSTQTLTFNAGSSTNQTFDVIVNNISTTTDKTFTFALQNPTGGTNVTVGSPASFTLTILGIQVDTTTPVPISQLRNNNTDGVPIDSGKYFTIRGVVTVANEFNSPSYMQDNTAGVGVYARGAGLFSSKVKVGDSVKVRGRLTHFRGLTQLDSIGTFTILDSNKVPVQNVYTISQILNQNWNGFESIEGSLVKINSVGINTTGSWVGNTNYYVYKGTDSVVMRITTGTNLVGLAIPSTSFNLIGVVGQYKSAAPYSDGYQVMPRFTTDIEPATHLNDKNDLIPNKIELFNNFPNPFNPSTIISYQIPVTSRVVIKIYNSIGSVIETLIDKNLNAGKHSIEFSGKNYSSGIYFYELNVANNDQTFRSIKKMILIK